ncbi:TolB family protein [Paraliomyxa miuraensis]|uniref:TolB family protein n=1 Tax=Paraliomyxa miuraensis TaxID=376150 RepID=UPI00224F2C33|nr:hypothetical protein [Paraliomyxa miuraensis]MCX4242807.1 hypothetical protein [Paraliomyxa miuraensis]
MSDASLTNIRMVKPKGPKIFFGLLAVAALGAGAWYYTRPPGPVGEREDPSRLLVVAADAVDVAATLGELGFDVRHGTFEALAAAGAKDPGGEGKQGIEAILHHADVLGIGYVALEDPSAHGIDGITVTGDSATVTTEHRFAVFSVGELGMPPKVTVDAATSALPLPPYVQVLRAAFGQDRLAGTLFAESQLPIDAVELHRKIEPAVALHGAYGLLDGRVTKDVRARAEALVDAEQAAPKPVVLAAPLETTEVLPLGDGTVLSLRSTRTLEAPREPEVSLQPGTELELWYHPPGSAALEQRQRCGSLRGGLLPLDANEMITSSRGDVVMLASGNGLELWTLDVGAGACAFTRRGVVPQADVFELSWGEPYVSGQVLRVAHPSAEPTVRVWTAGVDRPQVLPLPGCTRVGDPVWLDGEHLAISCTYEPPPEPEPDDPYDLAFDEEDGEPAEPAEPTPPPIPGQTWIYLARIADAHAVAIPGSLLGEHTNPYPLLAVPGNGGLDLLTVHPWGGKLLRLRSTTSVADLFDGAQAMFTALAQADAKTEAAAMAQAPADGIEPTAIPEPPTGDSALPRPAFVPAGTMVVSLPTESFTVTAVEIGVEFEDLALAPDGTMIAYTTDRGHEVQVMRLDGAKPATTVAKNPETIHRRPRFTADGKAVVFTSEFDGNDRFERVGQHAVLGGS